MRKALWKYVIFVVIVLVSAGIDLLTKQWAAGNLANPEHPLPLVVGDEDEGKEVTEFLALSRFPEAEIRDLLLLTPPLETKAGDDFPVGRLSADRGYYIYESDDHSVPPLFLQNPAWREYREMQDEGMSREDLKAAWKDRKISWVEVITKQHPHLNDEEAGELLEQKRIHPVPLRNVGLIPEIKVRSGDVFLLMTRNIPLIEGNLRFVFAQNPGAAWGFLRDAPLAVRIIFLQFASLLAMGLICFVVFRTPKEYVGSVVALGLVMGGAAGNFVERVSRLVVIDFIDMYVGDSHWPTYNVADIAISVGVGLLFIQVARKKAPF
jgi:lipoprotein signal peptidase